MITENVKFYGDSDTRLFLFFFYLCTRPRLHFTGGDCGEKQHKSLQDKMLEIFFPMKNFCAFLSFEPSNLVVIITGGSNINTRYCRNKLNDLNKGENEDFWISHYSSVCPYSRCCSVYGFLCNPFLMFHFMSAVFNHHGGVKYEHFWSLKASLFYVFQVCIWS